MTRQSIWEMREDQGIKAEQLSAGLGISRLLAGILIQRGIYSGPAARKFLWGGLEDLDSPWTLGGMARAVERIATARLNNELVVVYGDYDADGVCSIVLLLQCLLKTGCQAVYYVPDRFREGYGLNSGAVHKLAESGCRLLITVDCGINSLEEVELAAGLGMDVIITDHHNPGPRLPQAHTIINPKLESGPDNRDLAGVGVAYNLARALGGADVPNKDWLALAGLATIADVVPLLGDNRILVREGLKCLETTSNPGLQALLTESGLQGQSLSPWHVGFVLAPRLNSAGRLQHAGLSIDLLLTGEEQQAQELARRLGRLNEERKALEEGIVQEALTMVEAGEEEPAIVLGGDGWHQGVLGIAASRLCERYRKPVVMLSWEGENGRGSARSLESFNIFEGLTACQGCLQRFGGHSMAAGLSLERQRYQDFKKALCTWAAAIKEINPQADKKRWIVDASLNPRNVNADLAHELDLLKPWGEGNPGPVFALRAVQLEKRLLVGRDRQHFKACLAEEKVDCIAFNRPEYLDYPNPDLLLDLLGHLEENEFRGRKRLQIKLVDVKASLVPDDGAVQDYDQAGRILFSIIEQLEEHRKVLLILPTLRILQRVKAWLAGYFRSSALVELHGGRTGSERAQIMEQAGPAGTGIFLTTRPYINRCRSQLGQNDFHIIEILGREQDSERQAENRPYPGILWGPECIAWELSAREPRPDQRILVYTNRRATVERLQSEWPGAIVEAGLADIHRRQAACRDFFIKESGILLSDGAHLGGLDPRWSVDSVLFADPPFSLTEAGLMLTNLRTGRTARAGVLFSPEALEANHLYLNRLYPGLTGIKSIWAGLCSLERPGFEGPYARLARQLSEKTGNPITGLELISGLQILQDLDLCHFAKKGSIMAIKLMKQNQPQVDLSDSAYYLEGLAEKAALTGFENAVKSSLDW